MKTRLSPPWITYVNEVKALFEKDREVHVVYDDEAKKLTLYVDNARKADALGQLLPSKEDFGNVVVSIFVVPSNADKEQSRVDLIRTAFERNPALRFIKENDTPFGRMSYVVFSPDVVQFYNDDMSDINGNVTTLYQRLAKDVFKVKDGVYFCTAPICGEAKTGLPF